MARLDAGGGMMKVDAICAKLKEKSDETSTNNSICESNKNRPHDDALPENAANEEANDFTLHTDEIDSKINKDCTTSSYNYEDINNHLNGQTDGCHNDISSNKLISQEKHMETLSLEREYSHNSIAESDEKGFSTVIRRSQSLSAFGSEYGVSTEIAEMELTSKRNDLASSSTSSSNYDISSEPDTSINKDQLLGNRAGKDDVLPTFSDGASRRNKRKNTAPKNICQLRDSDNNQKDESSMYAENNKEIGYSGRMESDSENDEEQLYFEKQRQIMNNNNNDLYKNEQYIFRHGRNLSNQYYVPDTVTSDMANEDGVLDLSCSKQSKTSSSGVEHLGSSSGSLYQVDTCGALDLSSGKSLSVNPNKIASVLHQSNSSTDEKYGIENNLQNSLDDDSFLKSNSQSENNIPIFTYARNSMPTIPDRFPEDGIGIKLTNGSPSPLQSVPVTVQDNNSPSVSNQDQAKKDESVMKAYAESTVNELLSMYGLGDDDTQSFTNNIPLQSLTPGNILNKWSGIHSIRKEVASPISDIVENNFPTDENDAFERIPKNMTSNGSLSNELSSSRSVSPESVHLDSVPANGPPSKVGALFSPLKNASYPDYGKYVKRYGSYRECGNSQCADLQYREHFHCVECTYKVFLKKEEMIRHFKWHRKRDESLQHGFMRYSPMDDCGKKFDGCIHNGRQTHYHCLQPGCSKVYISTSDVQMHSNYHRKDSAIMQLGFQRFRATEDCGTKNCPFLGQRTTHFHCRKPGCHFTFKNKADIEKHKSYHQKDEILAKDGFKKFMKYETCQFTGCRFSKLANHIHCIRPGCDYVLHSTSQLLSHKRKHERREIEFAYRKFKEGSNQQAMLNPALAGFASKPHDSGFPQGLMEQANSEYSNQSDSSMKDPDSPRPSLDDDFDESNNMPTHLSISHNLVAEIKQVNSASCEAESMMMLSKSMPDVGYSGSALNLSAETKIMHNDSLNLTLPSSTIAVDSYRTNSSHRDLGESYENMEDGDNDQNLMEEDNEDIDDENINPESPQTGVSPLGFTPKLSPVVNEKKERDESWKTYLTRYTANDPCHSRCQFLYKDHYHCNTKNCGMLFRSKDGVREHAKQHEQLDRITALSYMTYNTDTSCFQGCPYNQKEVHYHCLWTECNQVISEKDSVFTRLDHYHVHELSRSSGRRMGSHIFRAQQDLKRKRGRPPKYPRVDIPMVPKIEMSESDIVAETDRLGIGHPIASGYKKFISGQACPDDKCMYYLKEHFHCVRKRCHHATDNKDVLNLHAKEFHNYITIQEGFEFFDRTVNCRRPHCHNNKANRHFHCVRPKCDYSFVRYSTMNQHDKKHKMAEMGLTPHPTIGVPSVDIMNQHTNNIVSSTVTSSRKNITQGTAVLGSDNKVILSMSNPLVIPKTAVDSKLISHATISQPLVSVNNVRPIAPKPVGIPQMVLGISNGNFSSAQVISSATAINNISPIVIQPITTVINTSTNPIPSALITTSSIMKSSVPSVIMASPMLSSAVVKSDIMPLAGLLKKGSSVTAPHISWETLLQKQHFSLSQNCNRPFCKLKRKDHYHCLHCNQAFSEAERVKVHAVKHGIKTDVLGNLQISKQVNKFTESFGHENKLNHNVVSDGDQEASELEHDADDQLDVSSSLTLNPLVFTNMLQKSQAMLSSSNCGYVEDDDDSDDASNLVMDLPPVAALDESNDTGNDQMENIPTFVSALNQLNQKLDRQESNLSDSYIYEEDESSDGGKEEIDSDNSNSLQLNADIGSTSSDVRRSSRKRSATRHDDFVDSDEVISDPKYQRVSISLTSSDNNASRSFNSKIVGKKSSGIYSNKDNLPEGYEKFLNKTPCTMPYCTYKKNVTHYHCMRTDCNFGTTDRSRLLQHTERHRRTDEVLGDEFRQFRGTTKCNIGNCESSGKGTHYHCVKCTFICTDMSKVMAHRKHHNKLEAIEAQGFSKVTGNDDCGYDNCCNRSKQTHYHCVQGECMYVATGPQQIQFHNKTVHPIQG